MLPLEVLEEAQRDLAVAAGRRHVHPRDQPPLEGRSTRSSRGARRICARWPAFPKSYHVLFLQGGASLQFSMVPMNLLPAGGSADYIVTGSWSQKAVKEAKRVAGVKIAATTEAENFARVPGQERADARPRRGLRPLHDQQHDLRHRVPLRARQPAPSRSSPTRRRTCSAGRSTSRSTASSTPARRRTSRRPGLTLVIVRDDLLARTPASLPTMLQYPVHVENKSMYNTPPVFAIYVMRLVLQWLMKQGGLGAIEQRNIAQGRQALRRDRPHRLLPRTRAAETAGRA